MGRASWGGQQDISGMLSSLINENFNQIKAGVNEALADAQDEQSAADQKTQAQWAAGKISDEKWLDYIRSRIQDSTDPTERGQWQGILLQNQDAISDAQWETRFQQNKITVGQLLGHYRLRMGSIEKNSPAYRELAGRNTELLQFKRSGGNYFNDQYGSSGGSGGSGGGGGGGGGSYGGSGSGSGGSGGGSGPGGDTAGLQGIINRGLKGGPTDVGYMGGDVFNTRGPNVVGVEFGQPAANTTASIFVAVEAGLEGTQKTLKGFFDFIEANPKATGYTIPGTGVYMAINAKTVRAADEQYMRVTATLIDVLHKKGTGSALSEANYQETQLGKHVTVDMRNHNAMFNQPNEDNIGIWAKRVIARMNAASSPAERERIAREAGAQLDKNMEDNFPEYVRTRLEGQRMPKREDSQGAKTEYADVPTTLEEQLPPEVYESHAGLRMIFDVGANPENYTDEDIDTIFDDLQARGDIGTGAGRIHLTDLMGNGGESSSIGGDSLGMGDFRLQHNGLKAADLIQRGLASPDDLAGLELYTYQWNSAANRMEPALAVATPTPDGTFDVVPAAVDGNGNISPATNATKYMSNVNGKSVEVWTPVINATPASGYVYRFGSDMTIMADGKKVSFKQGDLVPSSSLEALGTFNLNAFVQNGQFYKDTPPGIRQADMGGKTWYYDIRANTWFPTPPWDIEADKTDPNAIEVQDPAYIQNAQRGWSVDPANQKSAQDYILAPLDAGVEGYVMPFDESMSLQDMQKWLETEIANGHILPEEYRYMDADGNAVEMSQDQLMTSYYDPAVEARMESLKQRRVNVQYQRGAYGQPQEPEADPADLMFAAKKDMRIAAFERAQAARPVLGPPAPLAPDAERDERMRHLQQVAFGLGIQTGVLPGMSAKKDEPRVRPGIDDSLLRGVAIGAAQNRAKIARQPRLEPLPADPVAPRPKRQPLRGVEPSPPPIPMLRGVKVPKPAARPVAPEPLRHWAETF